MDPYNRLVWEVFMPKLRHALSTWSPRNCNPVIELVEVWKPLLPHWVLDNIVDQLLMPRLQREVDAWDPTTDTVPIHRWVHPWLPLMREYCMLLSVQPFYGTVLKCSMVQFDTRWPLPLITGIPQTHQHTRFLNHG